LLLYTGVFQAQNLTPSGFNPQIAVFNFSSISVANGAKITATGPNPLALLSTSIINFAGTLDAAGRRGGPQGAGVPGRGGPGGGAGGAGSSGIVQAQLGEGPGGGGRGFDELGNGSWGEGGGYGGVGGNWNPGVDTSPSYGDLNQWLLGGSGGGGGGRNLFGSGPGGGGGGGGLELGALTSITLTSTPGSISTLDVSGGEFNDGLAVLSGGGSGGGALLHAPTIALLQSGPPVSINASGFSGGRIHFLTSDATVQGNLSGLSVGANFYGAPGVISFGKLEAIPAVPAPLPILGVAAAFVQARRIRRRIRLANMQNVAT